MGLAELYACSALLSFEILNELDCGKPIFLVKTGKGAVHPVVRELRFDQHHVLLINNQHEVHLFLLFGTQELQRRSLSAVVLNGITMFLQAHGHHILGPAPLISTNRP